MVTNRIFICHIFRSKKPEEVQILHHIIEVLEKAGLETITHKDGDTEASRFKQLQDELPTCQLFLLLQTSDAFSTPTVVLAVKVAKALFKQKRLQGIFRFICPSATEAETPLEWRSLTQFDGTRDYQQACAQLVASLSAQFANEEGIRRQNSPLQTNIGNSSIPLLPLDAIPTSAIPALGRVDVIEQPAQTAITNPTKDSTLLEIVTTSTPRPLQPVSITARPSYTDSSGSLQIVSTGALPLLHHINPPPKSAQANYDRPPKPSIWKRLGEQRKLLSGVAIALVIFILIGSAGTLFFLNAHSPKHVIQAATSSTQAPLAPPPNPTIGQVSFLDSDQIGANNNTGITDEVQVNLQKLTAPGTGNSYYAWLLPNPGNSIEGQNLLLGPITISNGSTTLTFANPTHANLLLTESTFLVTEESANPTPNIPSPDQHLWRYYGSISQTPNPNDPNHFSELDYIRHLLGADPTLQALNLQGGLSTWFYTNVQNVFELSNATKGLSQQQNWHTLHDTLVSILDYLDGANNVAGDVPTGTSFLIQPPETAYIPLLTPDPAQQNSIGFIDHLETHLQGLTASPGASDTNQKLASQVDNELEKIKTHLQKVREDAKQLANLSLIDLADPKTAPTLTDIGDQANAALVGELNPTTNTRQGGATFVHDVIPQFATIDVKKFKGL